MVKQSDIGKYVRYEEPSSAYHGIEGYVTEVTDEYFVISDKCTLVVSQWGVRKGSAVPRIVVLRNPKRTY